MTAKIYLYKLDKETILREGLGMTGRLPKCRLEKIEKLKNEDAKCQSFAAGRLLVKLLAMEESVEEDEVIQGLDSKNHSEDNRTVIISDKVIHYNISHTGKLVAVAISEDSIGIDVEEKDDKSFKVTERMFSEEDKLYVNGSQERFREIWTSKEAFLKCTGEGISVPLKSFTLDFTEEYNVGEYIRRPIKALSYDLKGRKYYVFSKKTEIENCSFAICSENKNLLLDIEWVEVLL